MKVSFVDVDVGTPPGPLVSGPPDMVVARVHFHGFAGLPTRRGTKVTSPAFRCFGHRWTVEVYPGGTMFDGYALPDVGYVAVYLCNESPGTIEACFAMVVKHPTDHDERVLSVESFGDSMVAFESKGRRGTYDFATRETMLTYLYNGTLTIEVNLRMSKQTGPTSFAPSNPFIGNMLKIFNDEGMSDVRFEVGGEVESATDRIKRAKTATTFHASHVILKVNAPALADVCRPGNEIAVPIIGVKPEVFRMVLYFCYGGKVEEEELASNAKAIIDAADRFGIVSLKLQAEAVLTEQTDIAVENMLDNLLYAHSKNLAFFQETIMDFVAMNGDKIIGNVSFSNAPGELITDILTAFSRGKKSTGEAAPEDDLKYMRVGELRRRLHSKGLCIDGSREAMIALLREHTEGDDNENS